MVRGLVFAGVLAFGAAHAASFELHFVVPCGPSDKAYVLQGTTHEVCLSPQKVLDESAVVRVQRYPVINKAIVEITPAASETLLAASSANPGKELAVLFKDKLIFKAPFDAPLKLDKFQLLLNNAPEQVDALVEAFPGPKT